MLIMTRYKQIHNLASVYLPSYNLIRHLQVEQYVLGYQQINRNYCRKFHNILEPTNDRLSSPIKTRNKYFRLHHTAEMSTSTKDESILREKYKPRECRFENPCGYTAGLEWGRPEAPNKIFCSHGWLDNAGSFERLIPFFMDIDDNADKYHIISMDHPGLGLSTHKPPGAEYTLFSAVIEMKRIMTQLKWSKVSFVSHSLGAHHSFMYACMYPAQIDTLISIDFTQPITAPMNMINANLVNAMDEHFKFEYSHSEDPTTNIRVKVYSETEALQRLMDSHTNSLDEESARVLLKRGAMKQSWGYTFTRDVRARYTVNLGYTEEIMRQYLSESFKANLLLINGKESPYNRNEEVKSRYYKVYKENCPLFEEVNLTGSHHLHMNNPGPVAVEVNRFLEKVRRLDREKPKLDQKSNL